MALSITALPHQVHNEFILKSEQDGFIHRIQDIIHRVETLLRKDGQSAPELPESPEAERVTGLPVSAWPRPPRWDPECGWGLPGAGARAAGAESFQPRQEEPCSSGSWCCLRGRAEALVPSCSGGGLGTSHALVQLVPVLSSASLSPAGRAAAAGALALHLLLLSQWYVLTSVRALPAPPAEPGGFWEACPRRAKCALVPQTWAAPAPAPRSSHPSCQRRAAPHWRTTFPALQNHCRAPLQVPGLAGRSSALSLPRASSHSPASCSTFARLAVAQCLGLLPAPDASLSCRLSTALAPHLISSILDDSIISAPTDTPRLHRDVCSPCPASPLIPHPQWAQQSHEPPRDQHTLVHNCPPPVPGQRLFPSSNERGPHATACSLLHCQLRWAPLPPAAASATESCPWAPTLRLP